MNNETDKILPDSPEAAKLVTVTGWLSRDGRFYGDDERLARWAGSTHCHCRHCGTVTEKSWTACEACRSKEELDRFLAMPEAEWDGKSMVYSDRFDAYYSNPDDALEALNTHEPDDDSGGGGETLADARLVICRPQYASISLDTFSDVIPTEGDGDVPDELESAIDAFNKTMKDVVISWEPGTFRLKSEAKPK